MKCSYPGNVVFDSGCVINPFSKIESDLKKKK